MLVAAYVVSALLEVVGIGLVVFDVLADRARRVELTKERHEVYGGSRRRSGSDTALLMRHDISPDAQKVMASRVLENDRRLGALEANARRADELLQGVLIGMVSTPIWRRLLGPGARRARDHRRHGREHLREHLSFRASRRRARGADERRPGGASRCRGGGALRFGGAVRRPPYASHDEGRAVTRGEYRLAMTATATRKHVHPFPARMAPGAGARQDRAADRARQRPSSTRCAGRELSSDSRRERTASLSVSTSTRSR